MESNCLIIAGEKSGEEHCLSFFESVKSACPNTKFWGVGGAELEKKGMELVYDLKEFSSWGFSEVIGKIPFYFKAMTQIENLAIDKKCKVAILIDFQDFNLRLAKRLKSRGVEVLYYVAPQAWAWKAFRAQVLEKTVHTLFTIIPFEKNWFEKRGVSKVVSIDHPLIQTYGQALSTNKLSLKEKRFEKIRKKAKLLILPGSRNFEVNNLLPEFIKVISELEKDFKVETSIVLSPNVNHLLYAPYLDKIHVIYKSEELDEALINADLCVAASGTVTLATALFEVPTVVCYKSSLLNEFIFRTFLSYEGPISLANLVHERMVFPELVQSSVTSYNITKHLFNWLTYRAEYEKIKTLLAKTRDLVKGEPVNVSEYISDVINRTNV